MCWLFALARPATKSRGHAMVGPRNILLALAIVAAIAASSENAAEEQEDLLDALELCLDPFPCRPSPYTVEVEKRLVPLVQRPKSRV